MQGAPDLRIYQRPRPRAFGDRLRGNCPAPGDAAPFEQLAFPASLPMVTARSLIGRHSIDPI
jgi:hypothetical protein